MVHGGLWEHAVAPILSATRTELGLPPDPAAERLIAVPQLSFFPTAIDRRSTEATVTRVRRPGLPVPRPVRDPLIYVTLGSEIPGTPMFAPTARAAVEAARRTGLRVVISVASADPELLGSRSGIEVVSWVDHAEVLPRARALISHGGAGTTLDAIAAATPMVTVPFFADQPFNADSVVAAEAGCTVRPGQELTQRLTDALHAVLSEPPPGCARLADAVAALPDLSAAVSLLELQPARRPALSG
jgi:UDP:flavonoid glycosyltransferase YjiC (YdhE family)